MEIYKLVLFSFFLSITCASFAQVYTWTDKQGLVHFSDMSHQGSKVLKLSESQSYSSRPLISKPKMISVQRSSRGKKEQSYVKLAIRQPLNRSTIRNVRGHTVIRVYIKPKLIRGDRLQLIYDGSPLGDPQYNTVFELNGMYRGSHTLAVQAMRSNGKVLLTSDTITLYMQQPRMKITTKTEH